ncbi:MAG: acyl-CoA dehydrogenase family protein [Actinomycetota bacterium]|nr:acyl-CoA dehydrogenase family protein [Actinomycetota bacterium]
MDIALDKADAELQRRARAFTEQYLFPLELECEMNDGLSPQATEAVKAAVIEHGFDAINHAEEDGGRALSLFQQILIQEEMGKATGALWDLVWRPSLPMREASETLKDRYLRPACRGERRDAYAIPEEGAGSDTSMIETTATRDGDGWVIRGEKWHVTAGNIADFFLVHALVDGDPAQATVFFVDKDLPGVTKVRTPKYMHTFVYEHPIFAFDDVRVPLDNVLAGVGRGDDLTRDWFVEERLMIAARTVGAAARALDLALDFASSRRAFGRAIVDYQGIEFMLATTATEIMAAKSLLYRIGQQVAGELDRKQMHAMAAAAKLHCSEMAGRAVDRAVQVLGGRGYMREQPVERLWRELRVDRIWEGTSEIQRVIIGNELKKRGSGVYTGWPD